MFKKFIFCTAALILCLSTKAEDSEKEAAIYPDDTFLFVQRDSCELYMDIYQPAAGSQTSVDGKEKPTIIFMFGGGFIDGRRDDVFYTPWYKAMTELGYRMIAIDYRLGLKGATKVGVAQVNLLDTAIHMAVEDLFSATNFIIDNASTLGVDPSNLVISGSSAGAITVMQAEYELKNRTGYAQSLPEDFSYAGVMSFAGAILSRHGSLKYAEEPAPTLMLHGTADKLVNYKQIRFFNLGFFGSDIIAKRFAKSGYNYNILRFQDCGHEIASAMEKTVGYQTDFIRTNIMDGKNYIIDALIDDPDIVRSGSQSRKELYGKDE